MRCFPQEPFNSISRDLISINWIKMSKGGPSPGGWGGRLWNVRQDNLVEVCRLEELLRDLDLRDMWRTRSLSLDLGDSPSLTSLPAAGGPRCVSRGTQQWLILEYSEEHPQEFCGDDVTNGMRQLCNPPSPDAFALSAPRWLKAAHFVHLVDLRIKIFFTFFKKRQQSVAFEASH